MDITIPNNNEKEFLAMARRLGITTLRFLYPSLQLAMQKKEENPQWHVGALSNNHNELRRARQKGIFTATKSTEVAVLEAPPDMVIEAEAIAPKDGLHSRNSGLNHVLCALMGKKRTTLGISIGLLLNSPATTQPLLLGRMRQNARLATKHRLTILPLSCATAPFGLRPQHDLRAFLDTQLR